VLRFELICDCSIESFDHFSWQIWAATRRDIDAIMDVSLKMGFLTGDESAAMKQV
jgi:hypothetical protein